MSSFIPINLPLHITYRPSIITDRFVEFNGWITLDEKVLDDFLANDNFRSRAMDYHFSKNFDIISDIKLQVDIETSYLHYAKFYLEINGKDIYEIMKYEINMDINDYISRIKDINRGDSWIIEEVQNSKKNNEKGKSKWTIID